MNHVADYSFDKLPAVQYNRDAVREEAHTRILN